MLRKMKNRGQTCILERAGENMLIVISCIETQPNKALMQSLRVRVYCTNSFLSIQVHKVQKTEDKNIIEHERIYEELLITKKKP